MTFLKESKKNSMENNYEDLHDEDSEAGDTLSLCDLPLEGDLEDNSNSKQAEHRRSSDHEMFEFFNDLSSEMRAAEDIIFCGKLIPYRASPLSDPSANYKIERRCEDQRFDCNRNSIFHRKSDSMTELQTSQPSLKGRFMRNSHSLDYRKLERDSSSKMKKSKSAGTENDQIPAGKCFGKYDFYSRRVANSSSPARPRTHVFTFGMMKTPPEMELRDIKNRQNRMNPSSMFPMIDRGEKVSAVKRNEGKGSSWGLLRVLGCKGHANAVVTASLGCIPNV